MNTTKTLRLGFIMGGGVSLGTFSGAALSEAIKQQLVYGQYDTGEVDEQGQPIFQSYDKVEIDVFSGASAGAISLAIMLRVLVNPRDKFSFLGFRSYEQMREVLDFRLNKQFGERAAQMKATQPQKYEQLLAAQTLQEFQEKVWAKEVDLDRLLGTGAHHKDLSDKASLLDRSVIDNLGKQLFKFEGAAEDRLAHRTLLAKRVLFGCTLANFSHSFQKGHQPLDKDTTEQALLAALNDSSVARVHSELRVFDLNFDTIIANQSQHFPLRWLQYHEGDPLHIQQQDTVGNSYNKTINTLTDNEVWREITATVIASAAVPLAFEPVVLTRYRHEFGAQWAPALIHKDSYAFTYVDGGVFNNEPLQEALRLAATIDNADSKTSFDRQLIFVDPNVSELEQQFRIASHEKLRVGRSLFSNKMRVTPKSAVARMFGSLTHLISAMANEAQSIEVNRLSSVLEQFKQRDHLRAVYRQMLTGLPDNEQLLQMRQFAKGALDKIRKELYLPAIQLQLQQELLRVIEEERVYLQDKLPLDDERALVDVVNAFCYLPEPVSLPHAQALVYVLSCLQLDIALKLIINNSSPTIVPIAPFDFYNKRATGESWQLMPLPGKGLGGFTGFASAKASQYEIAYGKYCAAYILQRLQLTAATNNSLALPAPFDYQCLEGDLPKQVQGAIVKRLKEMIPSSVARLFPFLNRYLNDSIRRFISNNIQVGNARNIFEFRIRVPNDLYVLKGFAADGQADQNQTLQALSIHGAYYLVTKINYNFGEEQWVGANTNFMQQLYIEQSKFLDDVPALQIELPVMTVNSDAYLSPNPVFEIDIRSVLQLQQAKDISANNWTFLSEVLPLDQHLWGADKWSS
ncbi:MAG: patatin-like phospholipase family protein [Aureispira sp.]